MSNKLKGSDENNPIIKAFRSYAKELDDKHDRNERIVKISRDITIESKRIIFLLHTIDGRKSNKDKVLKEAEQRLQKLIELKFQAVAKELLGQDPYQYRSAYSPGLQEFIEAYGFWEYFKSTNQENAVALSDWNDLQQRMQYTEKQPSSDEAESPSEVLDYQFFVDPNEYILGTADLTGELMRRCINALGSGETDTCFETCNVLQQFYQSYMRLTSIRLRDLSRKIYTMRQSVLKTENVCYNVKIRGSEAAKWSAYDKPAEDVDEGFM